MKESVDTAKTFINHFIDFADKSRQFADKFYTDESVLSWNGQMVKGLDAISKFYNSLPNTTHTMISFDAQPVTSLSKLISFSILPITI